MSDVKVDASADVQVQEKTLASETVESIKSDLNTDTTPEAKETLIDDNKELINSLVDEKLHDLKSFYEDKMTVLSKQLKGQDRKNSELQAKVKEYEMKELTNEEKLALKENEMKEGFRDLYRERAIAKYHLIKEETDDIDFSDYINGDTEDEVFSKTERLKNWVEKQISLGIEKGIESRLAQGYKPQSAGIKGQKTNDISDMDKEEMTAYAKEVSQLPEGAEKDSILKRLVEEQAKRMKQ